MDSPFSRAGAARLGFSALSCSLLLSTAALASVPAAPGDALRELRLARPRTMHTLFASPNIGSMDTFERGEFSRAPIAAQPNECSSADLLVTPPALIVQSSGAILADVNAFRAILGNPNNGGLLGQQEQGHREINWDAVPPLFSDVFNFPPDFFNNQSPRGLLYDGTLRGLEVSSHSFTDINATYATEFGVIHRH